jgi:hypothetical protein
MFTIKTFCLADPNSKFKIGVKKISFLCTFKVVGFPPPLESHFFLNKTLKSITFEVCSLQHKLHLIATLNRPL